MIDLLEITAKITGLKYRPLLCRHLTTYRFEEFEKAFGKDATFKLKINGNELVVSWWVSAKRTRSYPYARVYDSLSFSGKKVTIIPIYKDEGAGGDRDFLQWDTISLMSLLGVFVIIGYYVDAEQNSRYPNKITNQRHDTSYLKNKLFDIVNYQSDALHWNIEQTTDIKNIGKKGIESYKRISQSLGIPLHSIDGAWTRIQEISKDQESFMTLSRDLAEQAQNREGLTEQPSEMVDGSKSKITITNWLGGKYYFTADEVHIEDNGLYLIEAKHTQSHDLPSLSDIKDGLIKMDLFTNLTEVKIGIKQYNPIPVLKLTTNSNITYTHLPRSKKTLLTNLLKEANANGFKILFNDIYLETIGVDSSLGKKNEK